MATLHYGAPRAQPKYVPAFQVTKMEGNFEKTQAFFEPYKDKNGKNRQRLKLKTVTAPRGFLVSFPRGHSIHIETVEEMERMGFTRPDVPLVDGEGEEVGSIPNQVRRTKEREGVVDNG